MHFRTQQKQNKQIKTDQGIATQQLNDQCMESHQFTDQAMAVDGHVLQSLKGKGNGKSPALRPLHDGNNGSTNSNSNDD